MTSSTSAERSAVLLDVDGVLVTTDDAVLELWAEVCRTLGRDAPDATSSQHILGCSPDHTARHLFPAADDATVADVLVLVEGLEPDLSMEPVPGAADLVRALHRAGVPVALVTGASTARLTTARRLLGLTDEVDATVTWGEARGKPSPDPYLLAARRLGVAAGQCVVVEDAPAGVTSAVDAGTTCLGVAPRDSSRRTALWTAGASAVVTGPHELRVHDGTAQDVDPASFSVGFSRGVHLVAPRDAPATISTRGTP